MDYNVKDTMPDFEESIKILIEKMPWLEEPIADLRKAWETYTKRMDDLFFRVNWLEMYSLRMMTVLGILLTDEQKETNEYQSLMLSIHQHVRRFNSEEYDEELSNYRKMAEKEILKLGVHPEEAIEDYRKSFPLEDLPKIITFDFIKTHFGEEQVQIYKRWLERHQSRPLERTEE